MNVFDLAAKISLDTKGYEKDLEGAKSSFSKFGDGLKSAAGKIGDVLATVGKTASAGIGAASAAVTALTKKSLDAVADYEQLVGGVDTLFKDSSQKLQDYANEAYRTAGMSANEYMEQAISYSATLIQGLEGDTEKAADLVNVAITDMADNVNKMGTSMEAVQNTYRGLSMQNFMMLDNLHIGYQGNATEMARLINDSKVMGDSFIATAENVKEISFDKYIEAIHVVQEQLGITGTTAKEAAGTITGSIASAKAAWQNFLTGTGSPAQFSKVLKDAIGNIKNNLKDIIPRLTEGLTELADQIAPELPAIIEQTLPSIINGASMLVTGLAERLPQLIPAIVPAVAQGIISVSTAIVRIFPQLITSLKESAKEIVKVLFPEKIDTQSITEITKGAAAAVGQFAVSITNPNNLKVVVQKADEIIGALINGLLSQDSINAFVKSAPDIIANLVDGIEQALLGEDKDGEGGLFGAAKQIIEKLGEYFSDEDNRQAFWDAAKKVLKSLAKGIKSILEQGVAPLMVEAARAWAECFVGEIDYYDTAEEIITRLGKAFVHNMVSGGIIGKWINDAAEEYGAEKEKEVESDDSYDVEMTARGMRLAGVPQAGIDAYLRANGHAAGFYANRPAFLTNDVVGENGDEVLLPLDNNTSWMDKFADKLNDRMTGGVRVENINVNLTCTGVMDESTTRNTVAQMIDEISVQLADLQGRESRGYGLGYRGGVWS